MRSCYRCRSSVQFWLLGERFSARVLRRKRKEIKESHFCPSWSEVGFLLPPNLVGSDFIFPTSCREVGFENSVQLGQNYFFALFSWKTSKIAFLVGYHLGISSFWEHSPNGQSHRLPLGEVFLKIADEARIKNSFSPATIWGEIVDNTPFSPAITWKENFLRRVRIWVFLLEVYEESLQKSVDKSLLNVLTIRGIFSNPVENRSLKSWIKWETFRILTDKWCICIMVVQLNTNVPP